MYTHGFAYSHTHTHMHACMPQTHTHNIYFGLRFNPAQKKQKKKDGIVWFSIGLECTAYSKNSSVLITHIAKGRSYSIHKVFKKTL